MELAIASVGLAPSFLRLQLIRETLCRQKLLERVRG
jgi:hypothetical protein